MNSLRMRVTLLAAGVAIVSLAAVGFYANYAGGAALRAQILPLSESKVRGIAGDLGTAYSRSGTMADAQRLLDHRASSTGKSFVVLDFNTREVLLASPRSLREGTITLDSNGVLSMTPRPVVVRGEPSQAGVIRRQRIDIANSSRLVFHLAPDRRVLLFVLPSASIAGVNGELPGIATLRRSLLAGVLVAILAAVAIALPLSARATRPLEQLRSRVAHIGDIRNLSATKPIEPHGTAEVVVLADAFNGMLERLKRGEELRRTMIADIAHELRTPLTNIRSHIESVQDGVLPPDATTMTSIHEEVLALQHLIDDLGEMTLADRGKMKLAIASVKVDTLMRDAVMPFAARASAAGVRLSAVAANEVPDIRADSRRMKQVIGNLVANSLAHTSSGDEVEISATSRDDRFVVISARDTGIGIPPEDVCNVFERFYRADSSRSRATGGVGLGLSIVKQIVELHGGTVTLESTPGVGTRVEVAIPVFT